MFKLLTLAFITSVIATTAIAQTTTSLYYDANWNGLDSKKKATYFRDVTLDASGRPIGSFKTFYKSGKLYSTAQASRLDKINDTKSVYNGKVQCFSENGKVIKDLYYDDDGLQDGTNTYYDEDTGEKEVFELSHGVPVKDHYIVYNKRGEPIKYSYLNRQPLKLSTSDKLIVPVLERKIVYQDGQPIQYYSFNGISVAVRFTIDENYGKYYSAYITIENGTDQQFDFNPADISSALFHKGQFEDAEVVSYADYIKKVSRRQSWSAAFNAFAEQQAANQAGYSASNTVAVAAGSSGTSVYGNGSAIYSNTNAVAVGASSTQSYNGASQYAARQNAANNISQYNRSQYAIRQSITQGYLKQNTVFPKSRVIGYVNLKFEKAEGLILNLPVNGLIYQFGNNIF